jgi:hypothetical protein
VVVELAVIERAEKPVQLTHRLSDSGQLIVRDCP